MERTSPWVRNVILLVGFVILVVIGIFTVVLPELEEAPPEESARSPQAEEAPESAQ